MTKLVVLYRLCRLQNLPILVALSMLLASVLMPPINLDQPVQDIQVTFDITQSMNVEDADIDRVGVSRLGMAKTAAQSLLSNLPCGSRIGWSVFTGQRSITLVTPLDVCQHYAGLLASLDKIDGRMRWVQASSIGRGLHQSMRAAQSIGDGIAVVFISDGHEAPPLRQGQRAMPDTTKLAVDGLIVGVGGDTPTRIPKSDTEGRIIGFWQAEDVVQQSNLSTRQSREELSRLHEDHLIRLGQLADLTYVQLDTVDALADTLRNARFSQAKSVPTDLGWIFALLALLALGWRFLPGF